MPLLFHEWEKSHLDHILKRKIHQSFVLKSYTVNRKKVVKHLTAYSPLGQLPTTREEVEQPRLQRGPCAIAHTTLTATTTRRMMLRNSTFRIVKTKGEVQPTLV